MNNGSSRLSPRERLSLFCWWSLRWLRFNLRMLAFSWSGVASILLGILSVVVGVWAWQSPDTVLLYALPIFSVFASAVAGVALSIVLAIKSSTPAQFANAELGGLRRSEALLVICYRARESCLQFLKRARVLYEILEHLEQGKSLPDEQYVAAIQETFTQNGAAYRARVESLQDHVDGKQARAVARIWAEVEHLGEALDVEPSRLSAHVLQYTPLLQADFCNKYIANWVELLNGLGTQPAISASRAASIARQNRRIYREAERRLEGLEKFLRYKENARAIVGLCGPQSSSGALLKYTAAVSAVARRVADKCLQGKSISQVTRQAIKELAFVRARQRGYQGVGLHAAARAAIARAAKRLGTDQGHAATLLENAGAGLSSLSDNEDKLKELGDERALQCLHALASLDALVASEIETSRHEIAQEFGTFLRGLNCGGGRVFIATAGYSKTVRESIKRSATILRERNIRTFVLASGSQRQRSMFRMTYELTEDSRRDTRGLVAAASQSVLAALLHSDDFVVVITGAEAFDSEGRFVTSTGDMAELRALLRNLKVKRIPHCLVIAAESYKQHDESLLDNPEFFKHHVHGIEVEPSAENQWDCGIGIISDGGYTGAKRFIVRTSPSHLDSVPRLGVLLAIQGKVTYAHVLAALGEARGGERIGDVLSRKGLVAPGDIDAALALQQKLRASMN